MTVGAVFPFVQFEFSHHIGPSEGRYVVRPDGAVDEAPGDADVLVVRVQSATRPRSSRLGRHRARSENAPDGPRELSITVVTVIKSTRRLAGTEAAAQLLSAVRSSPEEQAVWIEEALAVVNRAVSAYRACAADPYAIDLSRADARAVRIGHGPAGALVRGTWDAAIAVPPPRTPRLDRAVRLMPTEGMAAVLAGRSRILESEDLILRVVLDLEHGRARAAAAGLRAAHDLLMGELAEEILDGTVRKRFDAVARSRDEVVELAERAAARPLATDDVQRLNELAEEAGALVDARRYTPVGHG